MLLSLVTRVQDSCSTLSCASGPKSAGPLHWLALAPALVLVLAIVVLGIILATGPSPRGDDGNGGGWWWRRHDRPPRAPRPDLPGGHLPPARPPLERSHRRRPRPLSVGGVRAAPCAGSRAVRV